MKAVTGDIMFSGTDAAVNPVNCDVIMGKGIDLKFKIAYPSNFEIYRDACESGGMKPGEVAVRIHADADIC